LHRVTGPRRPVRSPRVSSPGRQPGAWSANTGASRTERAGQPVTSSR
jgi:hypothetical protein